MKSFLTGIFLFLNSLGLFAQQLAFPGAEGFGKYATGGRGGKVYTVTNLNDSGPGSFRAAFDAYPGEPLTIVFAVGGTIELKTELRIRRSNVTIAGQTAPGDGICLTGNSFMINGARAISQGGNHGNIIIRYLRSRPGGTAGPALYGFNLENAHNVIVDHCSFSWANEECAAMYDTKNVTVQWSIFSEGLYNSGHAKGNRSYGGVWGGQYSSFHHNLIAHQNGRAIRFNGARAHDTIAVIDYRNNVIYNAGTHNAAAGGDIEIPNGKSQINLINNYYKPGPATPSNYSFIQADYVADRSKGVGEFHVSGNIMVGNPTKTADNWAGVDFSKILSQNLTTAKSLTPFPIDRPLPVVSAEDAYQNVLLKAGVTVPVRDVVDQRVVGETFTGTAFSTGITSGKRGIIDSPEEVGGWPVYKSGTPRLDTDGDGMPDNWELANGLNPGDPEDRNNIGEGGYTMLEIYLNSLTLASSDIELPSFFVAIKEGTSNIANVNWTVSNESNIVKYVIERSTDGESFSEIGERAAQNQSGLVGYNFEDANALFGISYYRLKIVKSADVAYGPVVSLERKEKMSIQGTLTPFLQGLGAPSSSQIYNLSGTNQPGNINIEAPVGFEVSEDGIVWYGSGNTLEVSPNSEASLNQNIFVRLNSNSAGAFSGLIKNISATGSEVTVPVSGMVQDQPLAASEVLVHWPFTSNVDDNEDSRAEGVNVGQPRFNKFVVSDGSIVQAYSNLGQVFAVDGTGDGVHWRNSGPGGNVNREFYEEFSISAEENYKLRVDSILLKSSFRVTSSNTKLAVSYSLDDFSSAGVIKEVTSAFKNGAPLSATGAFNSWVALDKQDNETTDNFAFALNGNQGVEVPQGKTLKIRLYFACGSTSGTGRFAKLKDVYLKGESINLLPLDFLSFTAKVDALGKSVQLNWQTANEMNTKEFIIERRTDENGFTEIGTITSKNISGVHNYNFTDNNVAVGNVYYRLKQVDMDGKYTYSKVVQIYSDGGSGLGIYPNPVGDVLNITHKVAKNASLRVLSLDGKVLVSQKVLEGASSTRLNLSNFSAGTYLLIFDNGEKTTSAKIIKN